MGIISLAAAAAMLMGTAAGAVPIPNEVYFTAGENVVEVSAASGEELTEAQLGDVEALLRVRLDNAGLYDAQVKTYGEKVLIAFPSEEAMAKVNLDELTKKAELTFSDVDGNVIMTGTSEYISSAEASYGQLTQYGNSEYYISIRLTQKGREAFRDATAKVSERPEGENMIAITLDGSVITAPSVAKTLDSDAIVITGEFTEESSEELEALLNSAAFPFELTASVMGTAEGDMPIPNFEASENVVEVSAASGEELTEAQLGDVEALLRVRLDEMGAYDAKVKTYGEKVLISFPSAETMAKVNLDELTKKAELTFSDVDGNVIMTGTSEYIASAKAIYGQLDLYSNSEYYILLRLTQKGREAFKAATAKIAQRPGDENVIEIKLDGSVIYAPKVNETIDTDECVISGSFDKESAEDLEALLNSAAFPFELKASVVGGEK